MGAGKGDKSEKKRPLEADFKYPNDDQKSQDEEKAKEDEFQPVSYFSLYRYTSSLDKFLLYLGTASAILTGCLQPVNMLLFGSLTGDLVIHATIIQGGGPGAEQAKIELEEAIEDFAIYNSLIGLAMFIFSYLQSQTFNYCALRQIFEIRTQYLRKALNQDVGWYDTHQSGDFASRMSDDILKLEDGLGEKVPMMIHFVVTFLSSLILAIVKGWELALICLISLPVTMISLGFVAFLTSKLAKKEMDAYGSAGSIAEEVLSTVRTVLAFGGQTKETTRYNENLVEAKDNNIRRQMLAGFGFGLLWFFIYSSYALAFWYGVGLVLEDRNSSDPTYDPGNMVTVFFSVMTGSMNLGMSSPYIEVFSVAKSAGRKIFGVIENVPIINSWKDKGITLANPNGNISFKNVFFNYPSRPDVPILRGIDINIKGGETVALVGSSGCGKSTCTQLVQRFYDPDQGDVFLDGVNLRELNLVSLRDKIGVVGQEPVLFGTTIIENIRYGNPKATQEDVENAARKANAHTFIRKLPQGYNTLVGERGAQLSGGQKQRIAIARALVKEPAILLLDEATSALDMGSEARVQAALDNASKECTTIIIAHRLSTIRNADRILVLKKGVVVEEGTHDELIEKKGEYHKLVTTQVHASELPESGDKSLALLDDDEEDLPLAITDIIDDAEEDNLPSPSIWSILKKNKPEWKEILIACVGSAVMGVAMPLFAVLFGEIIYILGDSDEDYVRTEANLFSLYYVIAGVATGFATFFQIYMFAIAGEKLTLRIRSEMFDKMLQQEIGWYDRKENGVGALCAKLSGDASAVQGATGQRIGTVIQSLTTLGVSLGLSMYYEWKLGLVALAFAPIILFAIFMQQRLLRYENTQYRSSLQNSTKIAVEGIGNIRTVASLSSEEKFYQMYCKELLPSTKAAQKNTFYRSFVLGLARSIMFFAFATCMYYGGYLIREENMDFSKVFKVSQSLIMGTISIANALAFAPNFQKGLDAAAKVFQLLNRTPRVRDASNPSESEWEKGTIDYSNVTFSYPTRQSVDVLKGLNLNILRGKTVALVGPSGCGKSTIVQLLERYYDPKSGAVSIDGKNLQSMKMTHLRSHLGIVSQEPNLFNRTIKDNIAYGDNSREVNMQEVIEAAKKANIHTFITGLPMGYETRLGDKATQLSGGEKQRVAIARALVRDPQVLLLDEATSALDTESEKVVQDALDAAKVGRTCITIAHRLSTIQDADVICVVNDGVVVEMGDHNELLALRGLYFKLHSLQSGRKG